MKRSPAITASAALRERPSRPRRRAPRTVGRGDDAGQVRRPKRPPLPSKSPARSVGNRPGLRPVRPAGRAPFADEAACWRRPWVVDLRHVGGQRSSPRARRSSSHASRRPSARRPGARCRQSARARFDGHVLWQTRRPPPKSATASASIRRRGGRLVSDLRFAGTGGFAIRSADDPVVGLHHRVDEEHLPLDGAGRENCEAAQRARAPDDLAGSPASPAASGPGLAERKVTTMAGLRAPAPAGSLPVSTGSWSQLSVAPARLAVTPGAPRDFPTPERHARQILAFHVLKNRPTDHLAKLLRGLTIVVPGHICTLVHTSYPTTLPRRCGRSPVSAVLPEPPAGDLRAARNALPVTCRVGGWTPLRKLPFQGAFDDRLPSLHTGRGSSRWTTTTPKNASCSTRREIGIDDLQRHADRLEEKLRNHLPPAVRGTSSESVLRQHA